MLENVDCRALGCNKPQTQSFYYYRKLPVTFKASMDYRLYSFTSSFPPSLRFVKPSRPDLFLWLEASALASVGVISSSSGRLFFHISLLLWAILLKWKTYQILSVFHVRTHPITWTSFMHSGLQMLCGMTVSFSSSKREFHLWVIGIGL